MSTKFKGFISPMDDFGFECFTAAISEECLIANVRFFLDGRLEGRDPAKAQSPQEDESAMRHFGLIA